MKLIEPSFEIIKQEPGVEGMFKHIEKAARVCYRSEDKITDDSYKHMLEVLENKGHFSPLAHGTAYLSVPVEYRKEFRDKFWNAIRNKFTDEQLDNATYRYYHRNPFWNQEVNDGSLFEDEWMYCAINYRLIHELGLDSLLDEYWEEPNELSPKRITVKLETSIAVSRELNRHATGLAICEQSTRYCAYNKDKFGGEITCIRPLWLNNATQNQKEMYTSSLLVAEEGYLDLLNSGITAQNARGLLPLDTATTVFYTGFIDEWKHIFDLRTSNAAHPEVRRLMIPLQEEFKNRNYID